MATIYEEDTVKPGDVKVFDIGGCRVRVTGADDGSRGFNSSNGDVFVVRPDGTGLFVITASSRNERLSDSVDYETAVRDVLRRLGVLPE